MKKLLSSRYKNDGKTIEKLSHRQLQAKEKVVEEIKNARYICEKKECDCGNKFENLILISEKDRYGLHVETRICPRCGLLMTNPRMNQESYNHFYEKYYRSLYSDDSNVDLDVFYSEQHKHGVRIGRYLLDSGCGLKNARVLEIGTGMGGILSGIKEVESSVEVKGIDLGTEYIEEGKKRGVKLAVGDSSSEAKLNTKCYDIVILSHVLEHFLDIDLELENISKLLKEEGILYIEVPGILEIHKTYIDILEFLQNAHIRHFSLKTLQNTLNRNGYKLLAGNESIQSIFQYTGKKVEDIEDVFSYKKNISYLDLEGLEKNNWFFVNVYRPLSEVRILKRLKKAVGIGKYQSGFRKK